MYLKIKSFIILSALIIPALALADGDKDSQDEVFDRPGGWTQVLLGSVDLAGAAGLQTIKSPQVKEALKKYKDAKSKATTLWYKKHAVEKDVNNSFTSEAERRRYIQKLDKQHQELLKIRETQPMVRHTWAGGPPDPLTSDEWHAWENYDRNRSWALKARIITQEERNAAIKVASQAYEAASQDIQSARESILEANRTIGNKAVKGLVRVGQVLFIADLAGRVYVWNAMNADPTLTPVGSVAWHAARKALHLNASSTAGTAQADENDPRVAHSTKGKTAPVGGGADQGQAGASQGETGAQ